MKYRLGFLILGLVLVGFLCGFGARRAAAGPGDSPEEGGGPAVVHGAKSGRTAGGSGSGDAATEGSPGARAATVRIRSSDTLDDLLALADDELYGRLALWMLDANAEEIATFWERYAGEEKRAENVTNDLTRGIIDLVFIQWARLDPLAATAAAEGTKYEEFAWWAWGCHDPKAALAAAAENKPGRLPNVGWGIGEFHPEWLRENFDTMPEGARGNALSGFSKWGEGADPLAMLDFLAAHSSSIPDGMIKNLIRSDPWAAVEWMQKNAGKLQNSYGGSDASHNNLVRNLAKSHPDVLAQLAEREPSGARRRAMERALFESLVNTDLEAAVEQAETTKAPRVAAERFARIGVELAHADAERAFEMMQSLVTAYPEASRMRTSVRYPGGASSWGGGDGKVAELIGVLLAKDPGRLLNLEIPPSDSRDIGQSWTRDIANRWASKDIEGFAGWLAEQPAETRSAHAPNVAHRLSSQERHEEAIAWAMEVEANRESYVTNILHSWLRRDPEGVRKWSESGDLTDLERGIYEGMLPQK